MDNAIPYTTVHAPIPVGETRELMPFEAMQLLGDVVKRAAAMPDQLRRAAYVSALARFGRSPGWSYEFSDDAGVRMHGDNLLAELRHEQQQIDPDFVIWNKHCHPACKNGARYA